MPCGAAFISGLLAGLISMGAIWIVVAAGRAYRDDPEISDRVRIYLAGEDAPAGSEGDDLPGDRDRSEEHGAG